MYLFRNYVYICSRLKLNISPMHQINHGQVSLLLRIKTTKPGRIPGDVGGCHCQPGVERQSSDGLKTPAVHLFRKVELLFSEIKTTNKHTLYLSIFNRKKPNFRAFWKLCSHFFPFQWTFRYIFGSRGRCLTSQIKNACQLSSSDRLILSIFWLKKPVLLDFWKLIWRSSEV